MGTDSDKKVQELQRRVKELEEQLREERESFEWDLKAAQEAAQATIRKLEQQLEKAGSAGGEDTEMLAKRAMRAERRVSELELELKRLQKQKSRSTESRDSDFLRQRAEEAERERDRLAGDKRVLEAKLDGLRQENERLKQQVEEARKKLEEERQKAAEAERASNRLLQERMQQEPEKKELEQRLEQLQRELEEKSRRVEELEKLNEEHVEQLAEQSKLRREAENELARLKMVSGQMMEQRERETERLRSDLAEAERRDAEVAERTAELERRLESLQRQLEEVRKERDEARREIERIREQEVTQVGKPPEGESPPSEAADEFDVKTVKTNLTAGMLGGTDLQQTVREGRPLGSIGEKEGEEAEPRPGGEGGAAPEAGEVPEQPSEDLSELAGDDIEHQWLQQPAAEMKPDGGHAGRLQRGKTGTEIVTRDGVKRTTGEREQPPTVVAGARRPLASGSRRMIWIAATLALVVVAVVWLAWPGGQGQQIGDEEEGVAASSQAPEKGRTDENQGQEGAERALQTEVTADAGTKAEEAASTGGGEVASKPDGAVQDTSANVGTTEERQAPPEPTAAQKRLWKSCEKLLKKRKYARLARLASKGLKKYPQDARLHYYMGRALFYRKKRDAALRHLQRAVELEPTLAPAFYELVGMYLLKGEKELACKSALRFIELSPPSSRKVRGMKRYMEKLGCR